MSLPKQFFIGCLLILAGVLALVVAFDFLASIWGWLVGVGVLALTITVAVVIARLRRNRW